MHVPFPVFAGMRPAIPMNRVIPVRPTADPAPHVGMKSAKRLRTVKHVQMTAVNVRSPYAGMRSATRVKHVKHAQQTAEPAHPCVGMRSVPSMKVVKNVRPTVAYALKVAVMESAQSVNHARAVHLIAVFVSVIAAINPKTPDAVRR